MLFKSIATFATFALSAVSVFAAPAAQAEAAVLVKKDETYSSIPQIFANATTYLTPQTTQLQGIAASDLTVEFISPILGEITIILNEVVTDVKKLLNKEAAIVLATVDKTAIVTLHDLAVIVSELVHLVLTALGAVSSLLLAHPVAASAQIHSLLTQVGQLVGTVIVTVVQVAGVLLPGLQAAINTLLGDLSSIITQLSLTVLGGLLGLGGLL